ncbi:MAG: hypothetical protein KatS3mg103_0750 [Phycisphaerales bacterium]|nr:MAG: hypothetical protein KatS3mg103_0750 [Phycisphaerales bacterium]
MSVLPPLTDAAAVTDLTTAGVTRQNSLRKNPASWLSRVVRSICRKLPSSTP